MMAGLTNDHPSGLVVRNFSKRYQCKEVAVVSQVVKSCSGRGRHWQIFFAVATGLALVALLASRRLQPPVGNLRSIALAEAPLSSWPMEISLGHVAPAERPTVGFLLSNRSPNPITISHVIPSCSCVTAICSRLKLTPGSQARLSVAFDASAYTDYQGPFSKFVSVFYRSGNASRQRVLRVAIRGDVVDVAPFCVYPSTVNLGRLRAGSVVEATVYVTGWISAVRSLPRMIPLRPGTTLNLKLAAGVKAGPDYDQKMVLRIKISANARPGRFTSHILFASKRYSPVVLTVVGGVVAAGRGYPP